VRAVRYLVLGCGAIGGTVGAGLARDGHDVLLCDADPAVVEAVNARGLRIEGPVEQFTARLPAITPDALPAQIDGPVLLAVKSHHTAAAVAALAGRLTGDAFVVSLQNGLNTDAITAVAGPGRVVESFVNFGADMTEPGVVLRGNRGTFVIGEPDGTLTGRVAALTADIADAQPTTSVLGYLWAKQAYGAQLFATAVSDLPIYAVFDDPAYHPLLLALGRQVLDQAPVPAMPFDGFDPADLPGSLSRLADFNRQSAKTHSGVYRDLAIRHRPTEVAGILGPLTGPLVRRVAELIAAIERGERRCSRANLDLLAAYERLERLGRPLNAVVSALGAPARVAGGALADQPVAIKDIVAVAGVPATCGSPVFDPAPAAFDATLVARLRAAGAEVFATTQCLEYAAGFAHPDIGDTRNPRNPERTSGGSSGGSAALVAAGVCELAIGSDTGGSIRIPAAYCGIVGLKPSYGLVPVDGVFPLSPSCDHAGTLTASVAGTAALLEVLANPAPDDPGPEPGAPASPLTTGPVLSEPAVPEPVLSEPGSASFEPAGPGLAGSVPAEPELAGSVPAEPELTGFAPTDPELTGPAPDDPDLTGFAPAGPVLAGLAPDDAGPAEAPAGSGGSGGPGRPPVIGVLTPQLDDPSVTPEVRQAMTSALGQLAAAGWDLREISAPWLDDLRGWEDVLGVIVAREAHQVHAGRDTAGYAAGTRALLEIGAGVSEEQYAAAMARRDDLSAAIDASLAGLDALAGPSVGFVAPEQDPPFGVGEDSGEGRFTGPYNLSGHPAVSLPVPVSGLPVGLQLAGRRDQDFALLRVAAAAESVLGRESPGPVTSSPLASGTAPAGPASAGHPPA
jgi:2-dehydropantoate 2-reductase